MRTHARLAVVLLFIATVACSIDFSLCPAIAFVTQPPPQTKVYATYLSPVVLGANATQQPQDKTAEQVYHNIQALKGVPAPQLQQC